MCLAPAPLRNRRRGEPTRGELGAVAAEHVAAVLIVAALVSVVFRMGLPDTVEVAADHASCSLFSVDGCGELALERAPAPERSTSTETAAAPSAATELPEASDADRRDASRDASRSRRVDVDDDPAPPPVKRPEPGPALGEPRPGTSVEWPPPQAWAPVDAGAGPHGSQDPSLRQRARQVAAEAAANLAAGRWPDASRNLLHFLGNSGQPLEQDVDAMLSNIPAFVAAVDSTIDDLGLRAIEEAMLLGGSGTMTFPLASNWQGFGYDDITGSLAYDDTNWFYALGAWEYSVVGQVTVHPPTTADGGWRYEVTAEVHLRDEYNWDEGKATTIMGLEVTDEQLAELHRAGLAKEFTAVGTSSALTRSGER